MSSADAVSLLLLGLLVPDWAVVALLWRARRLAPENTALESRAKMSILLSVVASMIGLLGAVELASGSVPRLLAVGVIYIACVAVSVPQVHWLWLYWKGTWR